MTETIKTYLSACCKLEPVVEGSDEGTNYYVCPGCDDPCDPKYVEILTYDGAEFVRNVVKIVDLIEAAGDTPGIGCVSEGLFGVAVVNDRANDARVAGLSATVVFEESEFDRVLLPFDSAEGREALCRWFLHRRPAREPEFADALVTLADSVGVDDGEPNDVESLYEELSEMMPGVCGLDWEDDGTPCIWVDLLGVGQVSIWKNSDDMWIGHASIGDRNVCKPTSNASPLELLEHLLKETREASRRWRTKLAELGEKLDEWEGGD